MNVAYVHTGQWPSNSPSFTFVTLNAIGMSTEFEECFLFVKKNSNDDVESILKNNFYLQLPHNLSLERISTNVILNTNYFYYRKVVKRLISLIEHHKLKVVVTRNSSFLKYLIPLKKKYNIKVFFESHDFYADLSLRNDINPRKKNRFEKNENHYIPLISGVLCLQNSQKELYKAKFPKTNVYVARTGLHEIKNENISYKYVTYIGSLDQHKGITQLLKALALTETKPKLLIIGGKNSLEIKKLKDLVIKHYDRELVEITGWIDKKKLGDYLRNTAVGVIPLTETYFNKYLTSPLKLFDYYSFCIPVLATDLPTTRELILEGKTGLFFKDGNNSELAMKIDEIFSKTSLIDEMRMTIFNYAKELLWTNRAKKLKKIFEESEH